MEHKTKRGSGVYAYLAACGVLDKGTPADITAAKRRYWAERKRAWKKVKREEQKCFEIFLSKHELKAVQDKATHLRLSVTRYIKQAALMNETMLPPILRGEVRQLLMQQYNVAEELMEEGAVAEEIQEGVLTKLLTVQQQILSLLQQSGPS